jgi:hypothetical protein
MGKRNEKSVYVSRRFPWEGGFPRMIMNEDDDGKMVYAEREMDEGIMLCTPFVIYDDVYEFVIIIADKRKLRDDSRPNKIPDE